MSHVFVLDPDKQPLDPVHPGRARLLLTQGKAAVFRRYPFTIILKEAVPSPQVQALRLKIDPGSKTTGLALINDATGKVVWAAELQHRGEVIKKALDDRRRVRRSRRRRKTRYRTPRFKNRTRRKGWLPPSLESRIANTLTWARRLLRSCHITAVSMEVVKFDMHLMQHPEIEGVQYQQGELAGYEVREYLLEKWGRTCAYCGATDVALEVEHILCRARGGTHRIGNLTLACKPCNDAKGTHLIEAFLSDRPGVLKKILAQAKAPLKDAAAVNATRWALYERLQLLGLPLEAGTGGRTKWNRTTRGLPKTHWLDAVCVGASTPATLDIRGVRPLLITAKGYGSRQKCNVNKIGFPCSKPKGARMVKGFQTGDIVRAALTSGSKQGVYIGRVLVRASGSFDVRAKQGRIQGMSHRFCTLVHRCDGYSYLQGAGHSSPV